MSRRRMKWKRSRRWRRKRRRRMRIEEKTEEVKGRGGPSCATSIADNH
jgi:hypothetical protein